MNYLVLNVREYNFTDDNGKTVQGATITYLDLSSTPGEGERGHAPLSISASTDQARNFSAVPGYYEMSFTQRRGKNNRPQIVFDRAKLEQPVDLTP